MKEQFDRAIRNHIRDTFGSYNDQMADDGWQKFNNKKRRKKRGLIFWYSLPSGIAAALALVWLLNWNTLSNFSDQNNQLRTKNKVDSVANNDNQPNSSVIKSEVPQITSIKKTDTDYSIPKDKSEQKIIPINKNKPNQFVAVNIKNKSINKQKIPANISLMPVSNYNDIMDEEKYLVVANNESLIKEEQIIVKEKEFLNNEPSFLATNINKLSMIKNSLNFFNAVPTNNLEKTKTNIKDKFKVSIDATTYYSFSDAGVNDALNLGLGLATELKLTKRLSLNSGVLLNKQTTTFDGNEKSTSDFKSAAFSTLAAVPESQITNAKLIGLDIPLNLKFDFKMGKSKSFITTGISSYSVINEEYINDFSVINYSFTGARTSNITTKQENPKGNFSYFKFARTINLSFGMLYNLNKKSNVSIEPFIKYPVSGFGYQDLKIGSGGLSFKFNFKR